MWCLALLIASAGLNTLWQRWQQKIEDAKPPDQPEPGGRFWRIDLEKARKHGHCMIVISESPDGLKGGFKAGSFSGQRPEVKVAIVEFFDRWWNIWPEGSKDKRRDATRGLKTACAKRPKYWVRIEELLAD